MWDMDWLQEVPVVSKTLGLSLRGADFPPELQWGRAHEGRLTSDLGTPPVYLPYVQARASLGDVVSSLSICLQSHPPAQFEGSLQDQTPVS